MRLCLLLACVWGLAGQGAAAPNFPQLSGRVVDAAGILDKQNAAALDQQLRDFEARTAHQFVVVSLPDLQGYDIADYGYQLGRHWKIGDAKRDDGILLIIAPQERKLRIEVGYGLEGAMPDVMAHHIIQRIMLPRMREGDMQGGVMAGAAAIMQQLSLDAGAAQKNVQAVSQQEEQQIDPLQALIFFAFFAFFMFMAARNRRRARLWDAGYGGMGGWGVGGFGGGGFGGGGFGVGGGSFGGGGASGGW